MALPDLTGQNIENTYQRILQTDGINFYDGTGSAVSLGGSQNLQQVTDQGASTTTPITASSISASGDIIVTNITTSGDIIPTTHLTSSIGNDDNYFLTASIGRVRTFDTTIEFIDPTTKAIKGTLAVTDSGLEVKNASRALTTISASNAKITNKLQTHDISFSGTLIGTITGGTF